MIVSHAAALRFWNNIEYDTNGGCWLWNMHKTPSGHGHWWSGLATVKAHRAAWFLTYGEIPKGLNVCHKCDVPPCINPLHLFLGTQADNIRDMCRKGRQKTVPLKGEMNGRALLNAADVKEIRDSYAQGASIASLARRHNVGESCISRAAKGRSWKHMEIDQ